MQHNKTKSNDLEFSVAISFDNSSAPNTSSMHMQNHRSIVETIDLSTDMDCDEIQTPVVLKHGMLKHYKKKIFNIDIENIFIYYSR